MEGTHITEHRNGVGGWAVRALGVRTGDSGVTAGPRLGVALALTAPSAPGVAQPQHILFSPFWIQISFFLRDPGCI